MENEKKLHQLDTNGSVSASKSHSHIEELMAPRVAVPSTAREILGYVSVDGADTLQEGEPNSTRWVMEVELNDEPLRVALVDSKTKRILHLDTLGLAIAPLNAAYWDARPYLDRNEEGELVIHKDSDVCGARFLLTIDALRPREMRFAKSGKAFGTRSWG